MRRQNWLMVGVVSLAILGTDARIGQTPAMALEGAATPGTQQLTQTGNKSGKFVAVAHPTGGTALIITEKGKRYLELDSAFQTDPGPDLFVLLHRQNTPQTYGDQDFVNLGRLQRVKGKQRYAIPDQVNLEEFRSAVIWCRQFNVTFGFAPFSS